MPSIARANRTVSIIVYFVDMARGSLGIAIDAFVLKLSKSNATVGMMEGFSGIGSLLVGTASGVLADRVGRAALLRASAAACVLRSATLLFAIAYLDNHSTASVITQVLVAAGGIEGILVGFEVAPLRALLADSVPSADRSRFFAYSQSAATLGMAAGPAVAVAVFLARSNTWTRPELSVVILTAVGFGVVEAVLLCMLRDMPRADAPVLALGGERSDGCSCQPGTAAASTSDCGVATRQATSGAAHTSDAMVAPARASSTTSATNAADASNAADAADALLVDADERFVTTRTTNTIALLMAMQDVLCGLGSGMCYKFQPLFLWKDVGLGPIETHAIMASFQVAAAIGAWLIAHLAKYTGGPMAALLFRAGGSVAVRGALMNAIDGLTSAILNDHVARRYRARWNVFSVLSATGWSGSAYLGGYLADTIGYRGAFCVTLGLHVSSMLCILPCIWLVPLARRQNAQPSLASTDCLGAVN